VPLDLVLGDGTHVPATPGLTIGRAAGNAIRLSDPAVSRYHARLVGEGSSTVIEDAGSSYGTLVDGSRIERAVLRDGADIRIGDTALGVEARRTSADGGRTIVVRAGATLLVPAVGRSELKETALRYDLRPRVRSGWALKRLGAEEGELRYVLQDLRSGDFVRLGEEDAHLFELLDGRSTLHELILQARQRLGAAGPSRLAWLLVDLGDRGLLEGVGPAERAPRRGLLPWLFRTREWVAPGAGDLFEQAYRRGGFVLFTRAAYAGFAVVAAAGLAAFVFLVARRYGTPFVVASRVGLGALVFMFGRALVVTLHELAHGLTVASFGRRVPRAGLKLLLIFPYAFVDTSEAWFETRRRRIAISAAGPISDLVVGGAASLVALALAAGSLRDVVFQLAFAAYIGALYNLNPVLDRDGYQMLVDLLREPGLRRQSREWLAGTLSGRRVRADAPAHVAVYAIAGLAWSLLTVAFVVLLSRRYYENLTALAPRGIVWLVLGLFYLLLLAPLLALAWQALATRRREAQAGAGDAAVA
jgi:putative peptide zinc metalloprotease protein